MNGKKKSGRPRAFDEHTALNAAMKVFWAKGFHAASMTDLTEAMEINSPSLYASFGDKRQLYLKAIENYLQYNASQQMEAFASEADITKAVHAFIRLTIVLVTPKESNLRGCFLASGVATSAGSVEGAEELLRRVIRETERKLVKRFDAEKEEGSLPKDFPSLDRARLMYDLTLGHAIRARAGVSRATLIKALEQQVSLILE